jgi:hypothetical protein
MSNRINDFLHDHPLVTFIICGISFALFGLVSIDLVRLLKANLTLFVDYGTMVIGDGALQQLGGLVLYGYLSLALFIVFKTSEHVLVHRLTHRHQSVEFRD